MVKATFGNDSYYYMKGKWYGLKRGKHSEKSRLYPGNNTSAPVVIYGDLRKAAIAAGTDPALFTRRVEVTPLSDDDTEEVPKSRKSRRSAKKKSSPNSISIF